MRKDWDRLCDRADEWSPRVLEQGIRTRAERDSRTYVLLGALLALWRIAQREPDKLIELRARQGLTAVSEQSLGRIV